MPQSSQELRDKFGIAGDKCFEIIKDAGGHIDKKNVIHVPVETLGISNDLYDACTFLIEEWDYDIADNNCSCRYCNPARRKRLVAATKYAFKWNGLYILLSVISVIIQGVIIPKKFQDSNWVYVLAILFGLLSYLITGMIVKKPDINSK